MKIIFKELKVEILNSNIFDELHENTLKKKVNVSSLGNIGHVMSENFDVQ